MGRRLTRIALALAGIALVGAQSARAQLPITIDDGRTIEKSAGPWTFQVAVRLPGPPLSNVTVDWTLVPGSATAPSDFTMASGTLNFLATVEDTKVINVQIEGDTLNEWSPTLQQDEVFFVQLSNPSANARLEKPRATITLWDDDRAMPGVQFLAAASAGTAASGTNKLHWRVPAAPTPPTDVLIRWNTGISCTTPSSTTSPLSGAGSGQGFYVANFGFTMGGAGQVQTWPHTGLALVPHCYSLFAYYGASPSAELASIKAKPFDATGTVAWSYSTGATSVVPATVGANAIYTLDNAGVVHAMQRGPTGGPWPTGWNPLALGKPAQLRSPVVPLAGGSRLFVGTDDGGVHAVDGLDGRVLWSRSSAFGGPLPSMGGVQAAPAGLFKGFGGNNDMILVGTNNGGSNQFFALDPATGITQGPPYSHASMGSVLGMAVVDYTANRVLFLTTNPGGAFFGLDLGPVGTPTLTLASLPGGNPRSFPAGSGGSAVLRSNRVIFGDASSEVRAVDLVSGASYSCPTSDGQVKGFVWPDRRDDRLYFATNGKVQGYRDTGASFLPLWTTDVTTPSMVLQKPGSDYLYVGDGNGRLVQIDVLNPTAPVSLLLEAGVQIGAPSLDNTHNLVIVGSATGTLYAVRVPF